jgi:hypothetical protein
LNRSGQGRGRGEGERDNRKSDAQTDSQTAQLQTEGGIKTWFLRVLFKIMRRASRLFWTNPNASNTLKPMEKATLILTSLVFVVVLYIASTGPAWALVSHGHFSKSAFQTIYTPLAGLENHCPGDLLWRYENWWAPKIEF